jgi:type IV pilus assembly protein PilM
MTILKTIPLVSTTSIGLDIGTHSIKFVKLKRKGGSCELLSYGVAPVSRLKSLPTEQQPVEISNMLRGLLKGEKTSVHMVTAVSGSEVIIKSIDIPRVPKAQFLPALLWAGKKHLQIPLEETNFDYKILGEIQDKQIIKNEVMIVAGQKGLINNLIGLFDKSGLKVDGISVPCFALWNLLKFTRSDLRTIAWIDIGAKSTTIAIFQNNILRFSREILTAGDSINESIKSLRSLSDEETFSDEEAERLKKECDISTQDGRPEVVISIPPVVVRLIREIGRSFSSYQQSHTGSSIERVYLSGGTARLKGLPEMMQEGLGVDVEVIKPFENVKIGLSPMETARLRESGPIFSVAAGLALETGEGINLLPTETKKQRTVARLVPIVRIAALSLVAILCLLYWSASVQVKDHRKLLNIWTNVQEITRSILHSQQIKERTDRFRRMKKTLERLERREIIDPVILKEITNIVPKSIALKSLSVTPPEESKIQDKSEQKEVSADPRPGRKSMLLQMEGTVCSEEASLEVDLARFVIALNSSPFFRDPRLLFQKRNVLHGKNVLEFGLSCDLQ